MFIYKKENQLPIKSWIPEEQYYADEKMVEQVENLAKLPFAFSHIVLSPDGHVGYGMPIGGVLATQGVVIPNAVGVDIGCGMCAVKTSITEITLEQLKHILGGSKEYHGGIHSEIPVGSQHQNEKQDESLMPKLEGKYEIVEQEYTAALKQLGTLGGGNHFIEIQKGSDGHVWLMIHSGSRNFGLKNAQHYNEKAIALNEKWHSNIPKKWDLAFLPLESEEGQMYIREMNYCVDFALANRRHMMEKIKQIFSAEINGTTFDPMINIAHNYATLEHHFNSDVMVHRKGATLAREGTIGIIPGSQGTSSYIVRGKGNPESFNSCSHGAGRKMSRTKGNQKRPTKTSKGNMPSPEEIEDMDEKELFKTIKEIPEALRFAEAVKKRIK